MTSADGSLPQGQQISVCVDETIYDRATVLRACYWHLEHCYFFVRRTAPGVLTVDISAKGDADVHRVAGEFQNSLLEYEVRRLVQAETGKIRELLVAKAVGAIEVAN